MAEKRETIKIQDVGGIGEVHITPEVVTVIAALAATDVDGVVSLAGNITNEQICKQGAKALGKGIRTNMNKDGQIEVDLSTISIAFGKNILSTSKKIQERVKSSIENMTGIPVAAVNIHISNVDTDNN